LSVNICWHPRTHPILLDKSGEDPGNGQRKRLELLKSVMDVRGSERLSQCHILWQNGRKGEGSGFNSC
jgi:hypothetical protein